MHQASATTLERVAEGETLSEQIRRRRKALRVSQDALATRAGVHRNSVIKIERGDPLGEKETDLILAELDQLERRWAPDAPGGLVTVVELPNGTRVTFPGAAEDTVEAVRQLLSQETDE